MPYVNIIISSITALASVLLATFVYSKNRKSATNRYFAGFILFIGLYSLFNSIAVNSTSDRDAFFWSKFVMLSIIPIGPLFYFFVATFPHNHSKVSLKKRTLLCVWMILQVPLVIFNFTLSSVSVVGETLQIVPGPAIVFFMLMHIGTIGVGSIILINKYRNATGILKVQLQYVTIGILTSLILTIFSTAYLGVLLDMPIFIPISPLFLLIAAFSITYVIIKHRFLDIRMILVKSVAYGFLIFFIALAYIAVLFDIVFFFNNGQASLPAVQELIAPTLLAIFFAISFQPLRRFFEKVTDHIFYKDRYDANTVLWEISRTMASTLYLSDLCKKVIEEIITAMKINYGAIVLINNKSIIWVGSAGQTKDRPLKSKDIYQLIHNSYKATKSDENILIFEEIHESERKQVMRHHDITVVLPLVVREELIGGLLLGQKSSGEIYSSEDIELLKILSPEIAIAVRNALSFEEIKKFNVTLEQEVKKATQRLRNANKRLKELDQLKDEFVSIASHELRTPMTAIKSYLWMALNQSDEKLKDPLKKYLDISYNSTERLIRLVNDMLTVSRIERGKIELKKDSVELYSIMKMVYDELKISAQEKDIEFTLKKEKGEKYEVNGDKDKLREVLQNLVGNALKFTPEEGKITVTFEKKRKTVHIAITDTGSGIHKEAQSRLFQKFSKIDYSYAKHSSQPGTGLGLYISKQIVSLHNGDIGVESEVGVGSTFTVILPLAKKKGGAKK